MQIPILQFSQKHVFSAEFCPSLADPLGGYQSCRDWGAGSQFKVCEIGCSKDLGFSQPVPPFYTCGAEGFWRPTADPTLPFVYPACSRKISFIFSDSDNSFHCVRYCLILMFFSAAAQPAQRVFKISMLFPSSVLCNDAGQGVLRQKVRTAINQLNRDWNFCSYAIQGEIFRSMHHVIINTIRKSHYNSNYY